jgi:hypothetical protein
VTRIGVILNPRSRHNLQGEVRNAAPSGALFAAPASRPALDESLASYAAAGLDLLVIDGGDGTVREVISRAPVHFGGGLPPIAVLPSGKTNALALDLGAPGNWNLDQAIAAHRAGRATRRAPLEVSRPGEIEPFVRGFLFGAGVYVRAIDLAQNAHFLGVFDDVAVAATLGVAALRTLFSGSRRSWRRGVPMRLGAPGAAEPRPIFLLVASSLERLPLGLKPFGEPSPELRTLLVEAPPKRLIHAISPVLRGQSPGWLEPAGYKRRIVDAFDLRIDGRFVLDGDSFAGGELRVARGPELEFVRP